ncbi:MAG: 3-phosphoshikimate 1-carboxyvinyltransferase [Planctomycetota bacterium]
MTTSDPRDPLATLRLPLAELPDPLPIPTLASVGVDRFDATITPPGSKSLTNRLLLLAALAEGESVLRRPLVEADDARRMLAAVRVLGAGVDQEDGDAGPLVRINGAGGRWKKTDGATLNLNNAGTATRFLAASSVLAADPITIDGNERMRQRPIGPLVDALKQVGVTARYAGEPGCPPVILAPPAAGLPVGATITLGELPSSQFVSGLLMVGAFLPGGLRLKIEGEVTSRTYIDMTLSLLKKLGATTEASGDRSSLAVSTTPDAKSEAGAGTGAGTAAGTGEPAPTTGLDAFDIRVEPDASGATYWWAAAALCPGSVARVPDLEDSLQGDARFPEALRPMGVGVQTVAGSLIAGGPGQLVGRETDMSGMPDAAMSLAAAACFAKGPSAMTGLETLRVKECDRIAAMETELAKVGMEVRSNVDGDAGRMTFAPPTPAGIETSEDASPVEFDTYDDHRMAMSLALIGLRRPNVAIKDPGCVAKTYPTFFQDLATLYDAR